MKTPSPRAIRAFDSRPLGESGAGKIEDIKSNAAVLWDLLDSIPIPPDNTEAGRLVSLAKTQLEDSVMWGVKALSRTGF